MMVSLLKGVGVREEQLLRVGMDGEVEFDGVFVGAEKFGHRRHFRFGLWELTAVYLRTGITGGPRRFRSGILFRRRKKVGELE